MAQTTEQKVAQAVLQQSSTIQVGDRTFDVPAPTIATLILASAAISELPQSPLNGKQIVEESLYIAKDCAVLGDVAAILLLGAKNIQETIERPVKRRRKGLWGLLGFKRTEIVTETIDRKADLAKYLLENLSPRELREVMFTIIHQLQLGDFFGLTTFLIDLNLLRPTKVETETTAFGQLSEE